MHNLWLPHWSSPRAVPQPPHRQWHRRPCPVDGRGQQQGRLLPHHRRSLPRRPVRRLRYSSSSAAAASSAVRGGDCCGKLRCMSAGRYWQAEGRFRLDVAAVAEISASSILSSVAHTGTVIPTKAEHEPAFSTRTACLTSYWC